MDGSHGQHEFATTRWSVVLAAGTNATEQSELALAELCETYWYPLYAYVRRQGHGPAEAEDLTQGFFAQLIEHQHYQAADPQRGRFRGFLLTMLKRYLINEHHKQQAQKRGGGRPALSIDVPQAESRLQLVAADEDPDREFERQWALAMLENVIGRLQDWYAQRGKSELFQRLQACLTAGQQPSYAALADELQTNPNAIKVAVHRLRQRYRDLLRSEVAQTVADPGEVDAELAALVAALRSGA